jgi:hypothetical protein
VIDSTVVAGHAFEPDATTFHVQQKLTRRFFVVGLRQFRALEKIQFRQQPHPKPDPSVEPFLSDLIFGDRPWHAAAYMFEQFKGGYKVRAVDGFHEEAVRIGTTFGSFAATLKI